MSKNKTSAAKFIPLTEIDVELLSILQKADELMKEQKQTESVVSYRQKFADDVKQILDKKRL